MSPFKKKIEKLFSDFRVEDYRERADIGKFIEFWLLDRESPHATVVHIRTLNQLSKLLGTDDVQVTGGNFEQDQRGENVHTKVLVTAYGVKFPKASR